VVSWYGPGYGSFGSSSSCTSQLGPPKSTLAAKDRSMPYFTSVAVIGRPFSNRSPGRSVYVQVRPWSVLRPRPVARSGTGRPPAGPGRAG
jgi:hypothetical protein